MDSSKKYQIDQWVENALYTLLEQTMNKGQISPTDAATMAPLIQMYQAIQLDNLSSEVDSLWHLLADHEAGFYIQSSLRGVNINVKEMPQDGPQQPKKRQP